MKKISLRSQLDPRPPYKNKKYKGVYFNVAVKKWAVQIHTQNLRIYGGIYSDEKEAALIYDELAKKYFGESAYLNFPKKGEKK